MSNVVPKGWESYEIKDVALVEDRYSFTGGPFGSNLKSEDYTENGVRIIQLQNIGDGEFKNNYKIYTTKEKADELHSCNIYPNDIILSKMGDPVARAAIIPSFDARYLMASDGIRLAVDNSRFDTKYIHDMINAAPFRAQAEINSTGSTRKRIGLTELRQLIFIAPPLPEQQKIAAILSSVDDVIEKTQAQIDKLKDLKTGMMQELLTKGICDENGKRHTEFKDSPVGRIPVGWSVESFDDVFEFKNGVNKGKEYFGYGVPIISYRNVYDGGGIVDEQISGRVDMNKSELSRFSVKYGDLFITRTSETQEEIGFVNVYLGTQKDVVYSGFVIRARQKKAHLNPQYCKYAFQVHSIRNQMILNSKFTTRAGISGEALSKLDLAVPPKKEQEKISSILISIDSRICSLDQKNKAVNLTKKALMQDLLTGKVRVKVDPL